jgi:hypothetical protein
MEWMIWGWLRMRGAGRLSKYAAAAELAVSTSPAKLEWWELRGVRGGVYITSPFVDEVDWVSMVCESLRAGDAALPEVE